ncbi:MAG: DUF3883 domain-containing protein [Deltaproteobacteria bacterium]|nr:DUF3883 domain-containing protein [Deltaproteobacteria bacterium]
MNLNASPNNQSMGTYLPRGVEHLGFIEAKLRDLRGFATLAHELIQNADDAKANARLISFNVCDDALVVDNDGKFSDCGEMEKRNCPWKYDPDIGHSCDFHRFRTVASRDKREEEGTTGAFGIGFIAVYQITDHPEVISGNRHWLLHDEESEDKRIQVCPGCERCQSSDLPGTRFILPWAYDPHSSLRKELRAESVRKEDQVALIQDLESKLPVAMLFLKNIERIELRENGELHKYFERLQLEDQLIITDGNTADDRIWNIFKGGFEELAQSLRDKHPGRIEGKRSHTVHIAIPEEPESLGLYCVCLPTEHDTGLPFHINADFYPSSDRKKIILESDYQSQWNYAAIEGAAKTLANSFNTLPEILGHKNLWELMTSIFKVSQEAEEGKRHSILGKFWERLSPVLKQFQIIFTEEGRWVKPSEALLLVDNGEEEALSIFSELGLEIIHSEVRSAIIRSRMRWGEVLGIEQLTLDHFIKALQDHGLTERKKLSSLPQILQTEEGRKLLNQEIIRLLKRQRSPENKRELEKKLRSCAIALGRDGALWPCNQIYQANEKTVSLFSRIDPRIPFLTDMGDENAEIVRLCPQFSAKVAIECLERRFEKPDLVNREINPKELLGWFEARRDEVLSSDEVKCSLSALPIFPGPGGLYPLSELALPGNFEDPIGITEIIDLKRLGGKREFLEQLGAEPLSFEVYARDHIPRAFCTPDLPANKKRDVVQLLANEMGKIRGDIEIRENLAALPIIECEDLQFRQPEIVYFPEEIVEAVLGQDIPVAIIPSDNREAVSELYEWLGASKGPRASDIVDRIRSLTVQPPNMDSIQKIVTILHHLGDEYRRENELSDEFDVLKSLPWLPARGKRNQWFRPKDIYDSFRDYLFESQADFLEVPRDIQGSTIGFLRWLGVKSEPETSLVIKHLLDFSEQNKPVNKEVYSYLNNKTDEPAMRLLKDKACLLLPDNRYVTPADVFWGEQPFGRFRHQLSSDMRKYNDLLEKLGVRERPGPEDAQDVLLEIAHEYGGVNQPLDDDAYAVCMTCWRMLSQGIEEGKISEEEIKNLSSAKIIPDDRKILNPPHLVFFEDRAGIAGKFGEFLKHNVISRPQGAWIAMAKAGVLILSAAVEVRMLERVDPIEDLMVTRRVKDRESQLARIFEPLRQSISPENALSLLENLRYFQAKELRIQYLLRLFNRELESKPEDVSTFCHQDENTLYFVKRNGTVPWASIARELALSISPELDPGQLASGLKEVLSAESDDAARLILDELGFAPLETIGPVVSGTGELIGDFGGATIPEGSGLPPETEEVNGEKPPVGPSTPGEAIQGIFGSSGVPPVEATQPTQTNGEAGSVGGEIGGGPKGERTKGTRKKKGKLRTYVYPEESQYQGEPDSGASEERSAVDQAGVAHVVEYETSRGFIPVVMPPKHPGYDIESKDNSGKIIRYIEVKSLSGDWGMDGAALTKPQFEKARELGDRYWLYVVERAPEEDHKIHPIQNPAQRVSQFIYDDGWKSVVLDEAA